MKEIVSITVRTRDSTRILNHLTHPTKLGASKLTCRMGRWIVVPPTMLLLLSVLVEEFQSKLRMPDLDLDPWVIEHDEPPTGVRQRLPSLVDGIEMPPVHRELSVEFKLGLVLRKDELLAVFHEMTVSPS